MPGWLYGIFEIKVSRILIGVAILILVAVAMFGMAQLPAHGDELVPHKVRCQQVMVDLHNSAGLDPGLTLGDKMKAVTSVPCSTFRLVRSYREWEDRGDHAMFSLCGEKAYLLSLDSAMSQERYCGSLSTGDRERVRTISRRSEALKLARKFAWLACPLETKERDWELQPGDMSVNLCFKHEFVHPDAGTVRVGVTAVTLNGKFAPKVVSYDIVESPLIE